MPLGTTLVSYPGTSAYSVFIDPPQKPTFSTSSGFYTNSFNLSIVATDAGAVIYYTLDGSNPSTSSTLYTSPFQIFDRTHQQNGISMIPTNNLGSGHPYRENWRAPQGNVYKGAVVRAIAVVNGVQSEIATATYFVDPKGANRYALPVVSLATDAANLFSNEKGIYVAGHNNNFSQRGIEWERPIHIQFFENDGIEAFSLDAGVRIHGGTSRSRPLKTLRFYARGTEYGTAWINYPLFPDKNIDRYKRFLLRNSGNDWSESMFRDAFMHSLLQTSTRLDIMYARPAIVFINGEYWGIQNIRDRFDHHYISTHYGLEETQITILENNKGFSAGTDAGIPHYENLLSLLSFNSNLDNNRLAEVETYMDIDNFIDYQIAQTYFRNTDWPGNNISYWRYNSEAYIPDAPYGLDGRWRWMIFDTDFGFGLNFNYVNDSGQPGKFGGNNAAHNTIGFALQHDGPGWPNPPWSTYIFRSLTRNLEFKRRFANRYADMLNSTFKADFVVSRLNETADVYRPHMQEHILRWNEPANMSTWENEVGRMRTFASAREDAVRDHLRLYLQSNGVSITSQNEVTINVNNPEFGKVIVNSLTIDANLDGVDPANPYPWKGIYYRNVPISLTAEPNPGYEFVRWEGDVLSANVGNQSFSVNLSSPSTFTAVFEYDPSASFDDMNPSPWLLAQQDYLFDFWSASTPAGVFPPNMAFLQSDMNDPGLSDEMTSVYHIADNEYAAADAASIGFPYQLTARTRINGLEERGISLINTGRGRDLGSVLLALDTRGVSLAKVSFTAGTEQANSRVYAIRLQARVGLHQPFEDVLDNFDNPVEYMRNVADAHEQRFEGIVLPSHLMNQQYVQIRWKYYFTGDRLSEVSGQRDMLRLDDISVEMTSGTSLLDQNGDMLPSGTELHPNIPNPFNPSTTIRYSLTDRQHVEVAVYTIVGQRVATLVNEAREAGTFSVPFDAAGLSSGVYIVRFDAGSYSETRKISLIK